MFALRNSGLLLLSHCTDAEHTTSLYPRLTAEFRGNTSFAHDSLPDSFDSHCCGNGRRQATACRRRQCARRGTIDFVLQAAGHWLGCRGVRIADSLNSIRKPPAHPPSSQTIGPSPPVFAMSNRLGLPGVRYLSGFLFKDRLTVSLSLKPDK